MLLRAGADPNVKDRKGNTILHWAAEQGNNQVIRELLKNKDVNINAKNKKRELPIHRAAYMGHDSTVSLLIKLGASGDIPWPKIKRSFFP